METTKGHFSLNITMTTIFTTVDIMVGPVATIGVLPPGVPPSLRDTLDLPCVAKEEKT